MVLFPELPVSYSGFQISTATEAIYSPYNQVEEIWEEPGDKWVCKLTFDILTKEEFRILDGHLASLRGHVGISMITDTAHANAALTSSSLTCNEEGAYGNLLPIAGGAPSTLIARAGDRFQIGNQLLKVIEDATTDIAGECELKVQPEIRNPISLGAPLITNEPRGAFRLKDPNNLPTWAKSKNVVRGIQLEFVEALNV